MLARALPRPHDPGDQDRGLRPGLRDHLRRPVLERVDRHGRDPGHVRDRQLFGRVASYRSSSDAAASWSALGGGGGFAALVSALKLGRLLGEQPALKLSASNLYETRPVSPGTATSSCSSWSPLRLGVQYEKM